jgi:hypothetical protein
MYICTSCLTVHAVKQQTGGVLLTGCMHANALDEAMKILRGMHVVYQCVCIMIGQHT